MYNIPFPKLKNHMFPNLVYAHMLDLVQCGLRIVAYIRFGSFKELRKSNRDLTNYGRTKIKTSVHIGTMIIELPTSLQMWFLIFGNRTPPYRLPSVVSYSSFL
jgi:hypothetical protein